MRNIKRYIKNGKDVMRNHGRADMSLKEYAILTDKIYEKGIVKTVYNAFLFGVEVGRKLSKQ